MAHVSLGPVVKYRGRIGSEILHKDVMEIKRTSRRCTVCILGAYRSQRASPMLILIADDNALSRELVRNPLKAFDGKALVVICQQSKTSNSKKQHQIKLAHQFHAIP